MKSMGIEGNLMYKGKVMWELRGVPNCALIDMDNIITIKVCLNGVSEREQYSFENGSINFGIVECGAGELKDLFILLKIPHLVESEMPFNVNAYADKSCFKSLEDYEPGIGRPAVLLLVDTSTAVVKGMRTVGLGTEFSNNLNEIIRKQLKEDKFNRDIYSNRLVDTLNSISSEEMWDLSSCTFKIKSIK